MTPQEKAQELIEKFERELKPFDMSGWNDTIAYRQALICVEEILHQPYSVGKNIDDSYEIVKYWRNVKEELLNL